MVSLPYQDYLYLALNLFIYVRFRRAHHAEPDSLVQAQSHRFIRPESAKKCPHEKITWHCWSQAYFHYILWSFMQKCIDGTVDHGDTFMVVPLPASVLHHGHRHHHRGTSNSMHRGAEAGEQSSRWARLPVIFEGSLHPCCCAFKAEAPSQPLFPAHRWRIPFRRRITFRGRPPLIQTL